MICFDLKKASIFRTIKWSRSFVFRFNGILKKIYLFIFLIFFLIFLYGFINEKFSYDLNRKLLGLSLFFFTLFLAVLFKGIFFNLKLKKIKISSVGKTRLLEAINDPEKYNLAEFLSLETAQAVQKALQFAKNKKPYQVNSSILFYFLLADNPKLNFVLSRALLNLKEVQGLVLQEINRSSNDHDSVKIAGDFSDDFQNVILESLKLAEKNGRERVEAGDVLTALANHNPLFKNILIKTDLKTRDIENLVWWQNSLEKKIQESKKFWKYENLLKRGSLAKNWVAGYTLTLDQFSTDWTEVVKKRGFAEMIGHQDALSRLERALSGTQINNALLVGEPGSGRKSLIYALTQKAVLGQSLPEINFKRIVELDVISIITRFQTTEKVAEVLETIFQEATAAGNVILIIDEFYNFTTQIEKKLGTLDISGILARYLPLSQFRLVATTSYYGFHLFVENNPAILQHMVKVEVEELSEQETIAVLEDQALFLENKYKKFIPYPVIRDVVRYAARYIQNIPFPQKAIDLLDEVLVYTAKYGKGTVVLPEYVEKIISEKTDIPLGEMGSAEKEKLLNLENLIHQKIINQEEAVTEVSSALRRARTDISVRKGPMGCFLFLGPTGVGKTETAKVLAEIYFNSEKRMIRLDMSEFQNVTDIPRLLGSKEEEGLLTAPVRENPFSLVLLDEFEKAHPNILNLFLQVLDEGHLTDSFGRKVSFGETIIIATSNAGYEIILEGLAKQTEWGQLKKKLLDFIFAKAIFRPELINRFDAVVLFKQLTRENLLAIAELLLQKLKKNLKEKEIDFIITGALKEKIVELGWNPVFGAREMRRVIQDKVENSLASAILANIIKRGDKVEIDAETFQVKK